MRAFLIQLFPDAPGTWACVSWLGKEFHSALPVEARYTAKRIPPSTASCGEPTLPGRLGLEPAALHLSLFTQVVSSWDLGNLQGCLELLESHSCPLSPQESEDRCTKTACHSQPLPYLRVSFHCPLGSVCSAWLWCLTWPSLPPCGRRSQHPALCGRNRTGCGLSR